APLPLVRPELARLPPPPPAEAFVTKSVHGELPPPDIVTTGVPGTPWGTLEPLSRLGQRDCARRADRLARSRLGFHLGEQRLDLVADERLLLEQGVGNAI